MVNRLISEQDQEFILYDMLHIEQLFTARPYDGFSRDQFDIMRRSMLKMALEKVYPAFRQSGEDRCTLKDGHVRVPLHLHRIKALFDTNSISSLIIPGEQGGQGLSLSMFMACTEPFMHHPTVMAYTNRPLGTADIISRFGNSEQKHRYLGKLVSGKWGGPIAVTEPDAGSDIAAIRTTARPMPDGSYEITGTKAMITNGDSDLFSNILCTVMARVEGSPAGMAGLSLFLVPKFAINGDTAPGPRNGYTISSLADTMGTPGWSVCDLVFGENGPCRAEIIGAEGMALPMIFEVLPRAQLGIALLSTGIASAAYLHAADYARQRIQGAHFLQAFEPEAEKLAIIEHPDVRRMLITMKALVEAMRALTYYCGFLADRADTEPDPSEKTRLQGLLALLVPICRVNCSDQAFSVTETAMQVLGSAGYMKDHPIAQFMRDVKPASLYEGPNGIQALQLFALGMGPNGENFITLMGEIGKTVAECLVSDAVSGLARDLQARLDLLAEAGMFFGTQAAEGKMIIPVAYAYPWIRMLGIISFGWMLLRQAGVAARRLENRQKGIESSPLSPALSPEGRGGKAAPDLTVEIRKAAPDLAERSRTDEQLNDESLSGQAAFLTGKVRTAQYFMNHLLPEADALYRIIMSSDLSMMEIPSSSF